MTLKNIFSRSIVAALLVFAAAAIAGCGSDNSTTSGGDDAKTTQKVDQTAACTALTKMQNQIEKAEEMDVRDVSDVTRLATQFSRVNNAFEDLNAEVKKLPAAAQVPWNEAEREFRVEFTDAISDLSDAATGDNPASDSGKAVNQLERSFDDAYDSIDCD